MKNDVAKIEDYLRHLLAIQLYQSGASQQEVAKHLKISTGKCNELLKGLKRGGISLNENP